MCLKSKVSFLLMSNASHEQLYVHFRKKNKLLYCFLFTGVLSSFVTGATSRKLKLNYGSKYGAVRFISSHDEFIPQYSIADTVS